MNPEPMLNQDQRALCYEFRQSLPAIIAGKDPYLAPFGCADTAIYISDIVAAVCGASGVPKVQFWSNHRARPIARARQIAYALIREIRKDKTVSEIAKYFNRDPKTIYYGIAQMPTYLRREPETRRIMHRARAVLGA